MGWYVTNDVDTATYYMSGLSWDASSVSVSVPDTSAADFTVGSGAQESYLMDGDTVQFGFSEVHFFTAAADWADLSSGALFYRF